MSTASQIPKVTLADANGEVYSAAGTSGALTNAELRAASVPVDTELPTPATLVIGGIPIGASPQVNAVIAGHAAGNVYPIAINSLVDTVPSTAIGAAVVAPTYLWNGTAFDRRRVPAVFKTALATASGDTALWTPTAGRKVRLMRYQIQVTADASLAAGAVLNIVLRDATTALAAAMSVFVPAAAGTTFAQSASTGWVDLGNGILSAAANNVLNINLSAALTSGTVRVVACGTEE